MTIFLFTGPSASGKSTVAKGIADRLDLSLIGEREILHSLAAQHGFARSRHWLAAVGFQQVLDESLAATVAQIRQTKNNRGVILDGSYDGRLPLLLKETFPKEQLVIIALTIPQSEREKRIQNRLGTDVKLALLELQFLDQLKYKAGMREIIRQSNITIDNDKPITDAIQELHQELGPYLMGDHPGGPERR